MEIELMCHLFDNLIVTEVSHLAAKDEELLCRIFGNLCISGDGIKKLTSYNISTVGQQENLSKNTGLGHALNGSSVFSLAKGMGLTRCKLQAHFWNKCYSVGLLYLGRQLEKDFFLFISYSAVRKKNDWLAFGVVKDDQNGSGILCYILWRYRNLDLAMTSTLASPPPVFSHVHGGGRFFIHVHFISVTVCCHVIFSFLFSWYGKDYWFYILWGYKTFGKDHCRLLRRYISSSPSRRQQQAQSPSSVSCNLFRHGKFLRRVLCLPIRDDRVVIGVYYLRRILCLSTRGNKWFKHGTAPVLWMVWFVCDPSSPMVYNSFRSLL